MRDKSASRSAVSMPASRSMAGRRIKAIAIRRSLFLAVLAVGALFVGFVSGQEETPVKWPEGGIDDGDGTSARGTQPLNRLPSVVEHLVAGTVGGMSGVLVSYPLDTIRIRMQTNGELLGSARTASILLQEAGVAGFYRGVMSPVLGAGLIKAAVFGGYGLFQGFLRRATGKGGKDLTIVELGAAAMGSGLVGSFVVTPVERIKVVMQAAFSSAPKGLGVAAVPAGGAGYSNAWTCARGLVAEHGMWRGLYAGLRPTVLREIPAYAFYFATYEGCKRLLVTGPNNDAGDMKSVARGTIMFRTALSGGLAGIAAWLPVYPVDVIKSRMQSADGAAGRRGMLETGRLIWQTEGFTPFHRGLAPTLARAAVSHAATFLVYESIIEMMRSDERRRSVGKQQ